MKPTVSIFLDKRAEKASKRTSKTEKKYPLKLRVLYERQNNRSRSIGFDFTEKEYGKLLENFTKEPWKDTWNKIDAKIKRAEKIIDQMMPFFSFQEFWNRFFDDKSFKIIPKDKTSLNYIKEIVCENYRKPINNQYPMSVKIGDSVRSILKFTKTDNVPLRLITPEFCSKYEEYMYSKSKKRSRNGAGINLRHIRILFNEAIRLKLIPTSWYPFKRESGDATESEFEDLYTIPNERKVKEYLNEAELLEFSEGSNFNTLAQKRAHAAYLISYHCNGANAADFLNFKFHHIQGDFIVFYREKVKNATKSDQKPVKVYLSRELKNLIKEVGNPPAPNNYIFKCYTDSMTEAEKYKARTRFNSNASKSLKYVANHLDIQKNIRMGNARHSLANKLKKNKVDREFAKDLLGHTSIVTADNYFESFGDDQHKKIANDIIAISRSKRKPGKSKAA